MIAFWLVVLFGAPTYVAWRWVKHCRELDQKRSECLHRPTVVMDGTVDGVCRFCNQVVSR